MNHNEPNYLLCSALRCVHVAKDNKVTIDGGTNLAFSEDTAQIFAAKANVQSCTLCFTGFTPFTCFIHVEVQIILRAIWILFDSCTLQIQLRATVEFLWDIFPGQPPTYTADFL